MHRRLENESEADFHSRRVRARVKRIRALRERMGESTNEASSEDNTEREFGNYRIESS